MSPDTLLESHGVWMMRVIDAGAGVLYYRGRKKDSSFADALAQFSVEDHER